MPLETHLSRGWHYCCISPRSEQNAPKVFTGRSANCNFIWFLCRERDGPVMKLMLLLQVTGWADSKLTRDSVYYLPISSPIHDLLASSIHLFHLEILMCNYNIGLILSKWSLDPEKCRKYTSALLFCYVFCCPVLYFTKKLNFCTHRAQS